MTEDKPLDLEEVEDGLREKDLTVLHLLSEGEDDVQRVTSSTTLTNSEVNYCFQKLEDMDLITVSKPEGTVSRVVDGTKQVFEAPKQASLTDLGKKVVESKIDEENLGQRYEDLSRKEQVRKLQQLEEEMEVLKKRFELFRKQVQDRLNS